MPAEEVAALGLGLASRMSLDQLEAATLLFNSIKFATTEQMAIPMPLVWTHFMNHRTVASGCRRAGRQRGGRSRLTSNGDAHVERGQPAFQELAQLPVVGGGAQAQLGGALNGGPGNVVGARAEAGRMGGGAGQADADCSEEEHTLRRPASETSLHDHVGDAARWNDVAGSVIPPLIVDRGGRGDTSPRRCRRDAVLR
eukprot:CAMPEP_0183347842 /NCGR_PEP_ID=MMETSP0164_2-20130417/12536_1 /TAXON_ID=221442 /ORGANISM="Coccolithus pelagicus ssp braarudi, Strain PLY182g" /LENGTH=197 /DNA_ID=CAMNT_0025519339 /DNA_START=458 /DNA_END=1049 /DNA_ORIENTATION=-